MNKINKAYIAIDLHSQNSVIGHTDQEGQLMGIRQVQTSAQNLINQLISISAERKYLTIEQTNMAFTVAEKLHPYVDKLIICEPRHNKLISQNANKMTEVIPSTYASCFGWGSSSRCGDPRIWANAGCFISRSKNIIG